ncbi:DUF115 domain-containing protein [bacterium]|nr:DUF115 domain-containing protein [bacterium]
MSLLSKYPELGPLSIFLEKEEGKYQQKEAFPEKVEAEALFVFGIFPLQSNFTTFLRSNKNIEVVFLVDTLAELLYFVDAKLDKGFEEERLHVMWKEDGWEDIAFAEAVARRFPYEKVAFLQNGIEDTRFDLLKKTFLRKMVLENSVHKELINYPKLCENLFANIPKLAEAFDIGLWKDAFVGVPAIIGGAGPSLSKHQEALRAMQDKALIFAGGSTITAMDRLGIDPHLLFAIDPNEEEYDRLRYSYQFDAPLIYGNRVQKDIFRFFSGGYGYLRTGTGGLFDEYMDDKLGVKSYDILQHLSEEALSVTTIALMVAIHLGCNPIYFAGVDLSLKKEKRYSGDILAAWESSVKVDPQQQTRWMMEKDVIDAVAKSYPAKDFFDATGDGTTFQQVPVKRIEEKHFKRQKSLAIRIANLQKESKFNITPYQIMEEMGEIKGSLEVLIGFVEKYLEGELVYSLFVYEVEENKAFDLFFKGMVMALEAPLIKRLRVEKKRYSEEMVTKEIFAKVLEEAKKLFYLI